MGGNDENEDEQIQVCGDCVGESHLKEIVVSTGVDGLCSYCRKRGRCLALENFADYVETAFDDHYVQTAFEPEGFECTLIKETDYQWEREGEEAKWAILNAAEFANEQIAEDVREILADRHSDFDRSAMGEELPFAEGSHYAERSPDDGDFPYLWNKFERELQTEARFFSPNARKTLDEIFGDIENLRTATGRSVIVDAGPEMPIDHLFRARVFRNQETELNKALCRPWQHLGTPPSKFASAGRMNASGIAVFYGALEPETALTEVRPPVGSHVALACFNIARPLRLLDLDAFSNIAAGGSVFDPNTIVSMQRAGFLKILALRLTWPVMPHEEESKYLSTQVVSEYLAKQRNLDGIIFPSVQAGSSAKNVVLFHHAARVKEHQLPTGTEVKAHFGYGAPDEPPSEYLVTEKTPPISDEQGEDHSEMVPYCDFDTPCDPRPETLSIDLESVEVRRVTAVNFRSNQFKVTRTRLKKSNDVEEIF